MTTEPASKPGPNLPRVALLDGPTPLQRLESLADELGGRVELWVKREDLGPIAFSGNKLRNLEFLLGAAMVDGARTIVTAGRRWSNHCRLTAAAGARLGLEVHVVLSGPPVERSPNRDLIERHGATVHQAATDDREERDALVEKVVGSLRSVGRRVRVIPVGGSEAAGAWGQVLAGRELVEQAGRLGFSPSAVVLGSATGGTQAGLIVGTPATTDVVGVLVARTDAELRPIVERLAGELAAWAGIAAPPPERIEMDASQLGEGYGIPTRASEEAALLLARTEGLLVDPIYGAKALAAVIELVRSGVLDGSSLVFWHGGGLPSLFETDARIGAAGP